jgi:sugar phosphate permease
MMAHTPLAYLNETYGWRQALLLDAAAGVIILLWLAFILKDRPDAVDNVASVPGERASFLKILCNPQNGLAGLYTACLNLPIMVLCALWGASYLRVVHGLSTMAASNVVSLIFIGSVIGCPLVGWMSDVMGRRKPLMLMGGVATLLTLCPFFMNIRLSTMALSGLFFALGFFTSTQVISYPFIAESNCKENTGVATGVASMVIVGGGAVAQLLFGWLMNQHAAVLGVQDNVADFQYAMWLFPLSMVVALVCVMLMRETHCKSLMK